MLTIFITLSIGIIAGYLFRHSAFFLRAAAGCANGLIYLLLLSLGMGMGKNAVLLEQSIFIMRAAFLLFLGSTLGSATAGRLLGGAPRIFSGSCKCREKNIFPTNCGVRQTTSRKILVNSLVVLAIFGSGIPIGLHAPVTGQQLDNASSVILHALLLAVGVGIGASPQAWRAVASKKRQLCIAPLSAILGSLGGSLMAAPFISQFTLAQIAAAGSGYAYYSLSSILICAHGLPLLGAVSLLCNLMRELGVMILIAPLMRVFGPYGIIAASGAASMDTMLPFIARQTNAEYTVLSIVNGTILSIIVPLLLPFLLSL